MTLRLERGKLGKAELEFLSELLGNKRETSEHWSAKLLSPFSRLKNCVWVLSKIGPIKLVLGTLKISVCHESVVLGLLSIHVMFDDIIISTVRYWARSNSMIIRSWMDGY